MPVTKCFLIAAFAVTIAACGDNRTTTAPTPSLGSSLTGGATGATSATIEISSNAVSPQNVTVVRGAQVTFRNNDGRTHDIRSDSHPNHADCPEINQVGAVLPMNSRQTGILMVAKFCGFHDEEHNVQGTIQIQ